MNSNTEVISSAAIWSFYLLGDDYKNFQFYNV